ncbi:MAG TPA: hypothetical protein VJQ46_03840 [Gemmatimonadales bacterium]|nr:hypothetical protein [Gemmatimonadales bacterium]
MAGRPTGPINSCGDGPQADCSYRRRLWSATDPADFTYLKRDAMAGQGSTGNVIAALASFFIPGLGQLLQGRLIMAVIQFCLAAALWFILMGWIVHLWSILDAALWKPKAS